MTIGALLGTRSRLRSRSNKFDEYVGEFLALVFLQEVTRIADLHVLTILCAGDTLLKRLCAATSDWVTVAESRQKRFFPA